MIFIFIISRIYRGVGVGWGGGWGWLGVRIISNSHDPKDKVIFTNPNSSALSFGARSFDFRR